MATVRETLQALYEVQGIDSLIQRAKKSQAGLDSGKQATAQAEAAQYDAQSKSAVLHKLAGDLKDTELKLETIETKRKNYQQKLYQGTVTNAKELANIEKEIEALGRQRSDLDGKVLELMEQVEQAQADLTVSKAGMQQANSHRADILAAYRSRYDMLDLELSDLTRKRPEQVTKVEDKALLKRYDDIRARASGVGIAKVEGNSCGGCHMTLPAILIKAMKEEERVQTCENCGRLLLL